MSDKQQRAREREARDNDTFDAMMVKGRRLRAEQDRKRKEEQEAKRQRQYEKVQHAKEEAEKKRLADRTPEQVEADRIKEAEMAAEKEQEWKDLIDLFENH